MWRRGGAARPADAKAAFGLLEATLARAFPDLPKGFTWREGLGLARKKRLMLDWEEINRSLESYEAYRYGNGPDLVASQPELRKLVRALGGSW